LLCIIPGNCFLFFAFMSLLLRTNLFRGLCLRQALPFNDCVFILIFLIFFLESFFLRQPKIFLWLVYACINVSVCMYVCVYVFHMYFWCEFSLFSLSLSFFLFLSRFSLFLFSRNHYHLFYVIERISWPFVCVCVFVLLSGRVSMVSVDLR
jgi:hypothetical protein